MYIKLKSNVLFRNYKSFGYITDNRNFGYTPIDSYDTYIGDKITSESGAVFLSVLSKIPQSIDRLTEQVFKLYPDVPINTIKRDLIEFYNYMEQEGFLVMGKTALECEKNDIKFSYKSIDPKDIGREINSNTQQIKKETHSFFKEYFKGEPQLTSLHIEITSKCNERCIHCFIPHEDKTFEIDVELFYDIIRQCKDMNVLHLTLSGGEPMLHRYFCDFLRKCKEYDFSINILSNLTLLDDEITKEMQANPLLSVQVSLYSMNPDIHDEITQIKGSFEKTKNAILKLIENNIPLQISCPVMKQNKDCYKDVILWANQHKIKTGEDFVIIARYNNTKQNLDCRLSINELVKITKDKITYNPDYIKQVEVEAEKKKNTKGDDFICTVCNYSICISDNGNVFPCVGWHSYIVGDIKKTPLIEIWRNSIKVKYLRSIRHKDFPDCIKCRDREYCTICMVRNANESPVGNPFAVNKYFCDIAKLNRKLADDWKKNQSK